MTALTALGAGAIAALGAIGRVAIFVARVIAAIPRPPWHWAEFGRALVQIGWFSLPVVGLTALFTGGALALQIHAGGARFSAEAVVPQIVAIGMVRELGPVLGGLMVAGRVAAAIAAELGTMKVTEQIDALVTLGTRPIGYLAVPRLLAAVLVMPVLVVVGDAIGIFGGYLIGVSRLGFSGSTWIRNSVEFLEFWDIGSGLVKAATFGAIVALMGCYHGMSSGRGAEGVGRATTDAVVSASVLILAANFVLTEVFFAA